MTARPRSSRHSSALDETPGFYARSSTGAGFSAGLAGEAGLQIEDVRSQVDRLHNELRELRSSTLNGQNNPADPVFDAGFLEHFQQLRQEHTETVKTLERLESRKRLGMLSTASKTGSASAWAEIRGGTESFVSDVRGEFLSDGGAARGHELPADRAAAARASRRSKKQPRASVTTPKPFKFMARDKAKSLNQTTSTAMRRMQQDLDKKKEEEDWHLRQRFRARPPPRSTTEALFETMNKREAIARHQRHIVRTEMLLSSVSVFECAKDASKKGPSKAELEKKEQRKARAVRRQRAKVAEGERLEREAVLERALRAAEVEDAFRNPEKRKERTHRRAEMLYAEASLPSGMQQAYERAVAAGTVLRKKHAEAFRKTVSHGRSKEPSKAYFEELESYEGFRAKEVPKFEKMQAKWDRAMAQRKQSYKATKPRPPAFLQEDSKRVRDEMARTRARETREAGRAAKEKRKRERQHRREVKMIESAKKSTDVAKPTKANELRIRTVQVRKARERLGKAKRAEEARKRRSAVRKASKRLAPIISALEMERTKDFTTAAGALSHAKEKAAAARAECRQRKRDMQKRIAKKLEGRGFLFQQVDEEVREQKAEIKALSTFANAVGWSKDAADESDLFDEEEQEILEGAAR
tara:strand:+ start:240 stop:2162 length:1923 start_codon:yes stop_codon:yes gene_type:complete